MQDRAVGPGAGVPAAARAARRVRPGGHGPGHRGLHAHHDRMRQARVRRPGGLVRRPRLHRRAGQGAAVGRYADERRRLAGPEASAELRPGSPDGRTPRLPDFIAAAFTGAGDDGSGSPSWTCEPPAAAGPGHGRADDAYQRPGPRPAGRPRRATGPATPATSTSPTGSATWCPPRRAAAGCSPRRSSPASASASAPGRRCSR